jgi:hypothetical protein
MARPSTATADLTPAQAKYVLDRLVADRRISGSDVRLAVAGMRSEIAELEGRLSALRGMAGGQRPARATATQNDDAPAARRPRRKSSSPASPETLASRKLQGLYIGTIRKFAKNKRAAFKKIASEKGREAAIKAMRVALAE